MPERYYPNATVLKEVRDLIKYNLKDWKEYIPEEGEIEEEERFINLTVAFNHKGDEWAYQTGDNSFTGSAYTLDHWTVTLIMPDSTVETIFDDIIFDLQLHEYSEE